MTNIAYLPTTLTGGFAVAANAGWYDSFQFQYPAGAVNSAGASIAGSPIDITGIKFRLQVRKAVGQRLLLDAATDNGLIVVDGPLGQISFAVPLDAPALDAPISDAPAPASPWHMRGLAAGIFYCDLVAIADGQVKNLCQTGPLTFTVSGGYTDTDLAVT